MNRKLRLLLEGWFDLGLPVRILSRGALVLRAITSVTSFLSSLTGLVGRRRRHPPINRWAILFRPDGLGIRQRTHVYGHLVVLGLGLIAGVEAGDGGAYLSVFFSEVSPPPGQTVQRVVMQASGGSVYSLDLRLTYDPALAAVAQVQRGGLASTMTLAVNTNQAGVILAGLAAANPIGGQGDLLVVTFQGSTNVQMQIALASVNEGGLPSVIQANTTPSLGAIADQTVDEGSTLSLTATATDADLPANTLTFSLVSPLAGASINPSSGAFTWTPTEAQGPSTNLITVKVTDNGVPPLSATNSFNVVIKEVNTAPVLDAIADQTVNEGSTLTLTATATDADVPANTLTFSLVSPPAGASINATTGAFTWTPMGAQAPSTNIITVKVTDNGTPSLGASRSFTVVVREVLLQVSGVVRYWRREVGVPGVALTLAGEHTYASVTGNDGAFASTNSRPGDYTLTPAKSDDASGITAYDASLVLQHVVGRTNLTGPQALAADVDRSGGITTFDAVYILQKAVELIPVPFPGAGRVWDFSPANRAVTGLWSDRSGQDFTAVLLGDVSGNWQPTRGGPHGVVGNGPAARGVSLATARTPAPAEAPVVLALRRRAASGDQRDKVWLLIRATRTPIQSLSLALQYDAASMSLRRIEAGPLASSMALAKNTSRPGLIWAALAAAEPKSGIGAVLALELPGVSEGLPQIEWAELNEGQTPLEIDATGAAFDQDTDKDGLTDWEETRAGTNANDGESRLAITGVTLTSEGRTIRWSSVPGRRYQVESADSFGTGAWKALGGETVADSYVTALADTEPAAAGRRFYRIRLVE